MSRVRFVEACAAIPADALLLEVGPHALLRSPLRQNRATLPCAARSASPQSLHPNPAVQGPCEQATWAHYLMLLSNGWPALLHMRHLATAKPQGKAKLSEGGTCAGGREQDRERL